MCLWTAHRRQNVWWVGYTRSAWWIFSDKVHSLKMEQDQESIYLKEGSSFQPLRQVRISTSQLQQTGERLGSNRGAIFEWSGIKRSRHLWKFMINNKYSKKWVRSIYSLALHPHVMKLCRLTQKIYSMDARWTKTSMNRSSYRLIRSLYFLTHFINIDGSLMKSNSTATMPVLKIMSLASSISSMTHQCWENGSANMGTY